MTIERPPTPQRNGLYPDRVFKRRLSLPRRRRHFEDVLVEGLALCFLSLGAVIVMLGIAGVVWLLLVLGGEILRWIAR